MIHTNRIVTVGEQECIIDRPIVLYRGDREVEIEFTLVGNEFMFSEEGNVIKSVNASHGQLVLNTPSGEHMFSELAECHEGKVVFVVTKEMIDEFIEMGFYSFQIRLYDSAEMKSRVTIPPVMNGFDIRNPIAAEDETNVVDQGIVDYARIFKDQSNEELPTFDWTGAYNKTEWAHHDVITENKMNKIEDALYSINANIKESDVVMLNALDNVKKDADKYVKEHMAEVEADVEEFERNLNTDVQKFKVDTNAAMTAHKNEVSEELESVSSQLVDIDTHTSGYINIKEYEYLVDVDDWTLAIETAFNNSVEQGGMKVYFPAGEYKITRPITINFDSSVLESSFTIEGDGGLGSGILAKHQSLIKAYNIPNKRGAFEFLGVNNAKVTSMTINNMGIKLDYDSCEELSFCLFIGDGFAYTLKKCKLEGFNSVLIRCGSSPNAKSYAAMCCKFEQCSFITERYVDWDGETLHEKSKYGYAIAHEWMFTENNYTKFMCDNITYDTCFFGGTVFSFTTSTVFLNCMWYIPGGHKPLIAKGTDNNFNSNFFDTDIDCSIGLYIGGGFPTLINPYFEDVPKCIFMRGIAGQSVSSAKIINPSFLGTLNTIPVVNGIEESCKYAIKTEKCGVYSSLSIEGGSVSKGNTGFSEGYIINNGMENLEICGLSGITKDNVIDQWSRQRRVVYKNTSSDNLILEFEGDSNGSAERYNLKDTDIKQFTMDNNYIITKVEIIADKILEGGHTLFITKNNNASLKIPYGILYNETKTILEKGTATEKYTTNDIPYKDFENSIWTRGFDFKNNSVLKVHSTVNSWPSPDANAKIKVRIYLKC